MAIKTDNSGQVVGFSLSDLTANPETMEYYPWKESKHLRVELEITL